MCRKAGMKEGTVVGVVGPGRDTHTDIPTCWEFLEN